MPEPTVPKPIFDPWTARWALGLIAFCALPGILMAFGVDLSSQARTATSPGAALTIEAAFQVLRGPLTHTLLEWTSFCAAVGVCCLALLRYRLVKDRSMLIIGIAFACAGSMDAFHTLAADRLIDAVADNTDLIPFTWAICRLFNALILLVGVGVYLMSEGHGKQTQVRPMLVPFSCAAFVLIAYGAISFCANSTTLPNTMFPGSAFKRPYDLAALVPFLVGGLFVFPRYVRRNQTVFARVLFLSLIPQIATQLYMAFCSSALFDGAFNAAHLLKATAYLVPFAGLILEHARTHEKALKHASQVEASEIRIQAIMSAATDGLVVIDSRGIIESCNEATETLFGYGPGQLIGENVSQLVNDLHRQALDGDLELCLGTRRASIIGHPLEVTGVRKDGSLLAVRLSVNEVKIKGNTLYAGLLHDLTEEHELQTRLSQSQKLESIGQLAAGIAHEINTPAQFATDNIQFLGDATGELMELIGFVNGLVEDKQETIELSSEQVQEYRAKLEQADLDFLLEEIPKAIEQSLEGLGSVAHIVRAMKEFSHPGGVQKSPVDLNRTIENTVTVARNEWRFVAEVDLELDPALAPVPCLQGEFNQVVLNLVVNAAHAIAESDPENPMQKGTITITTQMEGDWVVITVGDTGCGMPPEVSARIFDPFFTTKDIGRGTGQGLAIARSVIVDKHQGSIKVESREGQGSRFTIRLPLEPEELDHLAA